MEGHAASRSSTTAWRTSGRRRALSSPDDGLTPARALLTRYPSTKSTTPWRHWTLTGADPALRAAGHQHCQPAPLGLAGTASRAGPPWNPGAACSPGKPRHPRAGRAPCRKSPWRPGGTKTDFDQKKGEERLAKIRDEDGQFILFKPSSVKSLLPHSRSAEDLSFGVFPCYLVPWDKVKKSLLTGTRPSFSYQGDWAPLVEPRATDEKLKKKRKQPPVEEATASGGAGDHVMRRPAARFSKFF